MYLVLMDNLLVGENDGGHQAFDAATECICNKCIYKSTLGDGEVILWKADIEEPTSAMSKLLP